MPAGTLRCGTEPLHIVDWLDGIPLPAVWIERADAARGIPNRLLAELLGWKNEGSSGLGAEPRESGRVRALGALQGPLQEAASAGVSQCRLSTASGERAFSVRARPWAKWGGCVAVLIDDHNAQAELRLSEERFRLAAEAMKGIVYDFDVRAGAVYRSRGFQDVLGYAEEEVEPTSQWWLEHIHPDDRPVALAAYARLQEGASEATTEYRVRHRDGRWVPLVDRAKIQRNESGEIVRVVGCSIDQTQKLRAEAAMRENEARLQLALRDSPVVLFQQDCDLRYLWIYNPSFGLLTHDVLGRTDREILADRDGVERLEWIKRRVLVTGEASHANDVRLVAPDGSETWWSLSVDATRDDSGRITGVRCVGIDITERKRSERLLERHRLLLHNARDIVLFVRPDGTIVEANRAAVDAYGYSHAELVGMNLSRLRATASRETELALQNAATAEGVRYETEHLRRNGESFPVEVCSRGVDGESEPLLLSIIRDISERRRVEQTLRDADRRKDEFLAMLGHELRNPLASILTGVQVLRSTTDPATDAAEMQAIILRQAELMAHLLDDLLDVSRITRGKIVLRKEKLDVVELLRRVTVDTRVPIEQQGCALNVDLPHRPVWVEGDRTRLCQVVNNLLHNAAKFTDPGGQIRLSLVEATRDPYVGIVVRDTGIGMTAEVLGRLFEPFIQAESSLDRSRGGLGLGLALVKGLTELHGGRVDVASDGPGEGSTFTVWLPLAREASLEAPDVVVPAGAAGQSMKVLLIDDRRDALLPVQRLLSIAGHDVRVAGDGPAGLELARSFGPDVVLCDIGLPGMSGYDVAAAIRRDPRLRGVYLVAATGYGQDDDRRLAERAGFDWHVTKPVGKDVLEQVLRDQPRFRTAGMDARCAHATVRDEPPKR